MVVSFLKFVCVNLRHILTGLGVYYYIQFLLYLRICLEGNRRLFKFTWAYGFFPGVDRIGFGQHDGVLNGNTYSNRIKKD